MASRIQAITVDAHDPTAVARFWARALDYVEDPGDPLVDGAEDAFLVDPRGLQPPLLFQRVPEAKVVKNRLHLDLQPEGADRDPTAQELVDLGATVLQDLRNPDGTGWVLLADPEGNEFCVLRSARERTATGDPAAATPAVPGRVDRPMDFSRTEGERAQLERLLEWYRDGVVAKVEGLTDEQAHRRHVASASTVASIVHHLAWAEDLWFTMRFDGQLPPEPWAGLDFDADEDAEFTAARELALSEIVDGYRRACTRSRAVAARASLDAEGAVVSPERGPFTMRWVLMHLLEETARHLGHLDILRELTDGRTGG